MIILFVCKAKPHVLEGVGRFVSDQILALKKEGIEIDLFPIQGKGILSYIKYLPKLRTYLNCNNIDIIHAHNGLTGFIANMQRIKPTIVTYHGSDINNFYSRWFSMISCWLSSNNIFISQNIKKKVWTSNKFSIIPCGVDTDMFYQINKNEARAFFGWNLDEKIVLFASNFNNRVKNPELARQVILKLPYKVRFVELKGFFRHEVALLLNAVDVVLLTSAYEGSPQIIKEAMACNCPIIATNVGDISERIIDVSDCYLTSFDVTDIVSSLRKILDKGNVKTNGRDMIFSQRLDSQSIARRIIQVYRRLLKDENR